MMLCIYYLEIMIVFDCGCEITLDRDECEVFERENLVILNTSNSKLYEVREYYYNSLMSESSSLAMKRVLDKFK